MAEAIRFYLVEEKMGTQPNIPNPGLLGGLLAWVIERFFGHWVTTVSGVAAGAITIVGALVPAVKAPYNGDLIIVGAILGALVGALAKDTGATPPSITK